MPAESRAPRSAESRPGTVVARALLRACRPIVAPAKVRWLAVARIVPLFFARPTVPRAPALHVRCAPVLAPLRSGARIALRLVLTAAQKYAVLNGRFPPSLRVRRLPAALRGATSQHLRCGSPLP